jgi:hypothetical protein
MKVAITPIEGDDYEVEASFVAAETLGVSLLDENRELIPLQSGVKFIRVANVP